MPEQSERLKRMKMWMMPKRNNAICVQHIYDEIKTVLK